MNVKQINSDYIPTYAHVGDAGLDLRANIDYDLVLEPQSETLLVPSGIAVNFPDECFGLLCSRSGLGSLGINVATGVSIIDNNYTGEIKIPIKNTSKDKSYIIKPGDRIAQLVILPYVQVKINTVDTLTEHERGSEGFGSSGL